MYMNKKSIITALLAVMTISAEAQSLTKQQMLEDYDQLYTTLTKNNPYFAVRKLTDNIDEWVLWVAEDLKR